MAMTMTSESPKYRSSLICCSPRTAERESHSFSAYLPAHQSPSTSSNSVGTSVEDSYDSNRIPKSIANEKLKIHSTATQEEVEKAIIQSKELILNSAQCSDERKWLVRYLVELRLRLEYLKNNDGELRLGVAIKGHHFQQNQQASTSKLLTSNKQYCDHCSGVIWNIIQGSYICTDCNYLCHYKCVDDIYRVCAHIVLTERGQFEMDICPERGLASQDYKCAECHAELTFNDSWNEPRLCDYTGSYFCTTCHWNDVSSVPARVVHNWDWEKRPVSRLAFQMLALGWDRPYIDVESINTKLFNFIAELEWVHKMRKDLEWMRRYLCACSEGTSLLSPLFIQLGDVNKKYSMSHLQAIDDGTLETQLTELTEVCRSHITSCTLCSGKGYLCEVCNNNEVLYPFDSGALMCDKCNSMYHRGCWLRKGQSCLKCVRLEARKGTQPELKLIDPPSEFDIDKFVV